MKFLRVEFVLELCRQHLDSTNSRNTAIDSILASYACGVIYAAFERRVQELLTKRVASDLADPDAHRFVQHSAKKLVRSIKISELSGLAGHFHETCKEHFKTERDEKAAAAWDAIVSNRHGLAHEDDQGEDVTQLSNLTFADVERYYGECIQILTAFEQALSLRRPAEESTEG